MGTLTANKLIARQGGVEVPVNELNGRTIQRYSNVYTGGDWNPDNTFNWVPGSWVDFTPLRADSKIIYQCRIPLAWRNAAHCITHWLFYVNGTLWHWHNANGYHLEDATTWKWEIPSWGTSTGRIGYQVRSYAVNNHTLRFYTTYYWNGVNSNQNSYGHLIVEEQLGLGVSQ